jgi:hypothetical protein
MLYGLKDENSVISLSSSQARLFDTPEEQCCTDHYSDDLETLSQESYGFMDLPELERVLEQVEMQLSHIGKMDLANGGTATTLIPTLTSLLTTTEEISVLFQSCYDYLTDIPKELSLRAVRANLELVQSILPLLKALETRGQQEQKKTWDNY